MRSGEPHLQTRRKRLYTNLDAHMRTWEPHTQTPLHTNLEAHMSMADDSIPRIFTGLRLQRKTPSRPSSCSIGKTPASPLTTVRGDSSPKSTLSTYRPSSSITLYMDVTNNLLLDRCSYFFGFAVIGGSGGVGGGVEDDDNDADIPMIRQLG